jgi:hypothetical protein
MTERTQKQKVREIEKDTNRQRGRDISYRKLASSSRRFWASWLRRETKKERETEKGTKPEKGTETKIETQEEMDRSRDRDLTHRKLASSWRRPTLRREAKRQR